MVGIDEVKRRRSFTELNYILNNMSESLRAKIPSDIITMIHTDMDTNYNLDIDITKSYTEQNYMDETKAFLSILLSDYLSSDDLKQKWKEFDKEYEEIKKRESVAHDNNISVFDNKETDENIVVDKHPVEAKKESVFRRFVNKIKSIFGKY